jgi:hypothetical protein
VASGAVETFTVERQTNERLDARHISLALDKIVFVVQRDFTMFHERRFLDFHSGILLGESREIACLTCAAFAILSNKFSR